MPRLAGTPRIVVHARTMFGDLRLRSLAPGESPSRWRALMNRLAERLPPIPPLPPCRRPAAAAGLGAQLDGSAGSNGTAE